jgi:hypothetical protein
MTHGRAYTRGTWERGRQSGVDDKAPVDEVVVERLLAGQRVGSTVAERREALDRADINDASLLDVARRLGCSPRTVERRRSERATGVRHRTKHKYLPVPVSRLQAGDQIRASGGGWFAPLVRVEMGPPGDGQVVRVWWGIPVNRRPPDWEAPATATVRVRRTRKDLR